jgi:hypothetical protein
MFVGAKRGSYILLKVEESEKMTAGPKGDESLTQQKWRECR